MKFIFLLFLMGFLLTGCSSNGVDTDIGFSFMLGQEAYELIASDPSVIVLDVRTEDEFLGGHIAGSVLLPVDEIEERAASILHDKEVTILVICRSGNRSQTASQLLVDLGFTNVYDIGGIISWQGEITN